MKTWNDFSLSPKDKGLPLLHPLRCETIYTSSTCSLSICSVSFDHLKTGSLAKNRRCPAKLWQMVQLYLLCFYWCQGKSKKDILSIWSSLCAAMTSDWMYHRWYNVSDNCSGSTDRVMAFQEWAETCPSATLRTPQTSCSTEIHYTVLARIGTTSQQCEVSPNSSLPTCSYHWIVILILSCKEQILNKESTKHKCS